ncbi:hypothetical protein FLK61_31350 [Paenalkalicoccus suaedae]|uniref:Uncharacterized protein n=1 Tax=Paenalkalicoccus suaedae TaxID=2592382 RepID=A0A859FE81_9BACI|nr:hypothetical protein [Paenalkalicoccus suaedae]QKS71211.1 hypothetical protein FLK61_31350 [Paenalkalicoccus suaedae]
MTRLPGVFWCNYFGKKYVDFFQENTIKSFPWFQLENLSDGILTFLSESPLDKIVKDDNLEIQAKKHLGKDSFGDSEEYKKDPMGLQIKRTPFRI